MNKQEIQTKYLALHDALGSQKDADDKELFDQQHRQVWADCDTELKARKAELEPKEALADTEKVELGDLEAMLPTPSPPVRDLAKAIDDLKARLETLELK